MRQSRKTHSDDERWNRSMAGCGCCGAADLDVAAFAAGAVEGVVAVAVAVAVAVVGVEVFAAEYAAIVAATELVGFASTVAHSA